MSERDVDNFFMEYDSVNYLSYVPILLPTDASLV